MIFSSAEGQRSIDIQLALVASEGAVIFGDTKEGAMAIRVRPELRIKSDPRRGGLETVFGQSLNSEGQENKAVWGQPAQWVDYFADVQGHTVGIAIFDHPSNPRHPTRWHAREYGLIAANPFGLHGFTGAPGDDGRLSVEEGDRLELRYKFVFHEGRPGDAQIARAYELWIGGAEHE